MRVSQGDSDRDFGRSGLMSRNEAAALRAERAGSVPLLMRRQDVLEIDLPAAVSDVMSPGDA